MCNDRVIDTLQLLCHGLSPEHLPTPPWGDRTHRCWDSAGAAALGIPKALPAVGHAPVRVQH